MDSFLNFKGKSKQNKNEYLRKMQAEKEQLKRNKEQGGSASII